MRRRHVLALTLVATMLAGEASSRGAVAAPKFEPTRGWVDRLTESFSRVVRPVTLPAFARRFGDVKVHAPMVRDPQPLRPTPALPTESARCLPPPLA